MFVLMEVERDRSLAGDGVHGILEHILNDPLHEWGVEHDNPLHSFERGIIHGDAAAGSRPHISDGGTDNRDEIFGLERRLRADLLEAVGDHLQAVNIPFHLRDILIRGILIREELLPRIERRDRRTELMCRFLGKPNPEAVLFTPLRREHDYHGDSDEDEDIF